MLTSDKKFGFTDEYEAFFNNVPISVHSANLNNAVRGPDSGATLNWTAVCQNMSTVFDNWNIEIFSEIGKLADESKRPLLRELEDGNSGIVELILLVLRVCPLLELISDIIEQIVESGILTHIKKRDFPKENPL